MTTSRFDFTDRSVMLPGETHDVPDHLARRLIDAGQAEPADPVRVPKQDAGRRERAVRPERETR